MGLYVGKVRGGFGRRLGAVSLGILLAWGSLILPARGQSIDSVVSFDIPAQPLGTALTSLAVQASLQIFFEQAPVEGLAAPPRSFSIWWSRASRRRI